MKNWLDVVNFSIAAAGLMITLFGFLMTGVSRFADKRTRRFLFLFFAALALYLASSFLAQFSELYTDSSVLTHAAKFMESLFSSLLMPLLALYMLIRCDESPRCFVMFLVDFLWIVYFCQLAYAQMSTSIYYITSDNVFHRGPYYYVLLLTPVVTMLVILIAVIRRRSRLTRKQFPAFLIYVLIPVIAMIIQMFIYGIHFIVLGTVVASGFMMVFLLTDQAEQAALQQRKIADQQASLLVLQMRPHFIYNTMMSIYYLCVQDPSRAQKVILDFSQYLKKNFTAISKEEPIPFEEELEHARVYLAVEQVRFEDSLYVKYDTPYTDFELPPLTLQPLVENSVKHGVDPELDPLTIFIKTEKTDTGYDVIVADTGPGFGSSEGTSGNRVALSNIRDRLDMIGGSLTISDREGGGSVVTLHIPAAR